MSVDLNFYNSIAIKFTDRFESKKTFGCKNHGESKGKYCSECGRQTSEIIIQKTVEQITDLCPDEDNFNVYQNKDGVIRILCYEYDVDDDFTETEQFESDDEYYRYSWVLTPEYIETRITKFKTKYSNFLKLLKEEIGDFEINYAFTRTYG